MKLLVKLIFKLIAAPVLLILTLANAMFRLILALSGTVLGLAAMILMPLAIYIAITISLTSGIIVAVFAALISPYGLPKFAEWLADLLDDFGCLLKDFIFS
jgi:hypothetical protein